MGTVGSLGSTEPVEQRELQCCYAESREARAVKASAMRPFLKYFDDCGGIVDLGCGDGVFLELLLNYHQDKHVVGVELNEELAAMCKRLGLPVIEEDVVSFVRREGREYDGFVMSDLVEHLDIQSNLLILTLVPLGAIVFIKTPNTNSILGHQFYLQSPSHKAPYCPIVLKRLLERTGFEVIEEGESDGVLRPRLWIGHVRKWVLKLLFLSEFDRIFGGGNYFVVAKKVRE